MDCGQSCTCRADRLCNFNCGSVDCMVTVEGDAHAAIRLGSARGLIDCARGSTCSIEGGSKVSTTQCAGTCSLRCSSANCTLGCSEGSSCTVSKAGAGDVICTGPGCP